MGDGTRVVEPTSAFGHLRADPHGVVHVATPGATVTSSLCGSRNQYLMGGTLIVNKPPPIDWPTCVYCIAYKDAEDAFMARMDEMLVLRASPPLRRP